MKIAGVRESSVDYTGKFGPVFFTCGCNFKCGSCHNSELINEGARIGKRELSQIMQNLKVKTEKGWYTGVCISGGEPTLQPDLIHFAKKLKEKGLAVKLDTNGSKPEVLEELLKENVMDYVAMDVKGRKEEYNILVGTEVNIEDIEKSMKILSESDVDYEFRTTVVPVIIPGRIKAITPKWIDLEYYENMAKWIVDVTGSNQHKHYLQKFVAREEEMVDERLSKEKLDVGMHETPDELMQKIHEKVKEYLPNCKIR